MGLVTAAAELTAPELERLGKLYGSEHEAVLIRPVGDDQRLIVSVLDNECRIALERTQPEQRLNPGARRVETLYQIELLADELAVIAAAAPAIIAALEAAS